MRKTAEELKREEKEMIKKMKQKYKRDIERAELEEQKNYIRLGKEIADALLLTATDLTEERIAEIVGKLKKEEHGNDLYLN